MAETRAKVRKWGSSLAAVIPPETLRAEGIREGDEVVLEVRRVRPPSEMFGFLKARPGPRLATQRFRDGLRREEAAAERRREAQHRRERRG